jgi:hypothetical protein
MIFEKFKFKLNIIKPQQHVRCIVLYTVKTEKYFFPIFQASGIFENIKEKAKNGLAVTKRNFL